MALIGSSIDPRLFVQDYSGFAQAANTRAAGLAGLGTSIGNALSEIGKQKQEAKRSISAALAFLKAGELADPNNKAYYDSERAALTDPSISMVEQGNRARGIAASVEMLINRGDTNRKFALAERAETREARSADQQYNANEMKIDAARRDELDDQQAAYAAAPLRVDALAESLKANPRTAHIPTPEWIEGVKSMTPGGQMKMVEKIAETLPGAEQYELVNNVPVTLPNGKPGVTAIIFGKKSGRVMTPTIGGSGGVNVTGGRGVLPELPQNGAAAAAPKSGGGFMTIEGNEVPESEVKRHDSSKYDIVEHNGVMHLVAKESVAAQPAAGGGVTLGASTERQLTEKEQYEMNKDIAKEREFRGTAMAKSQEFISALNELYQVRKEGDKTVEQQHPGFTNLFGSNIGVPTWWSGSSGADARVIFEQLEGKGFLESVQAMRGMGALSNMEGETVSAAFMGLKRAMSEKAAKKRIVEIKRLLQDGQERIKTNELVNPDGSPMIKPSAQSSADRVKSWDEMTPGERLRAQVEKAKLPTP